MPRRAQFTCGCLNELAPSEGQRVLEIAAGPGDTGFLVAPFLGSGRLVSTDLSSSMVDAARKRGAELGITNADYATLDAQAMDLPDASFDGVICRWGFMLMPDPAAALPRMPANPRAGRTTRVRRVHRPGEKSVRFRTGADSRRDGAPSAALADVATGNSRPRRPRPTRITAPRVPAFVSVRHRVRRHDMDVRRYRRLLEISHRAHCARPTRAIAPQRCARALSYHPERTSRALHARR